MAKVGWITIVAASVIGMSVGAQSEGAVSGAQENATLDIQVYDYAKLDADVLRHFLNLTQELLASGGMSSK